MTALSFVWVHPYSQNSRCDINVTHLLVCCLVDSGLLVEHCNF